MNLNFVGKLGFSCVREKQCFARMQGKKKEGRISWKKICAPPSGKTQEKIDSAHKKNLTDAPVEPKLSVG